MLCPLCGMSFTRRTSLSLHMQVHLQPQLKGELSDDPETSKKVLPAKRTLKAKKEKAEKARKARSPTADKPSKSSPEVKGPVLCEYCGQELKNRARLIQHHHRVHKIPRKRILQRNLTPMPCPDCKKVCRGPSALKQHKRTCGIKESLCEVCGKVYQGSRALSNHKYQMHKWRGNEKKEAPGGDAKTEKPDANDAAGLGKPENEGGSPGDKSENAFKEQVCQLCRFVARYPTSMRSHLVNKHKFPKKRNRAYNSEPVSCPKCGTVCKGPGALKLHEKRFCLQTTNLQCPICNKICTSRKNLSRHKYNHKWWGTEKEKAWREKRRLLGIPVRKRRPKAETETPTNQNDEPTFQLVVNVPLDGEHEELAAVAEGPNDGQLPGRYIDANALLQAIEVAKQTSGSTGELQTVQVQLPLANHTLLGTSEDALATATIAALNPTDVAIPIEEAAEETITSEAVPEEAKASKLMNLLSAYQVVLMDEHGQPVLASLPNH